MACKVKNTRLSAIYDVILSLTRDNPNIKTLGDIQEWFKINRPGIQPEEIVDALVATTPKKVNEAKSNLTKLRNGIKREAQISDKLTDLINQLDTTTELTPDQKVQEVNNLTKELLDLVLKNTSLSLEQKHKIALNLGDIDIQFRVLFKNQSTRDKTKQIIERLVGEIKADLNTKNVNERVKDLDKKIESLEGDEIDASAIADPDANVRFDPLEDAIAREERELSALKGAFERLKSDLKIKARATEEGLFGFKSEGAINFRINTLKMGREGWEVMRTLKFMFDASAFGVQLAPVVIPALTKVDLKALASGNMTEAFASQRQLAKIFRQTFIDVVGENLRESARAYKAGDKDALRKANGLLTARITREIKNDPLYELMVKSDLKISEARSLSRSEEMFHSTILNKWRVLGLAKDISEDTMIATLNSYRAMLFKEFHLLHPGLSDAEYKKVARFINNLTGTSHVNTGAAAFVLSAPRLALSRLQLAFIKPLGLIGRIDAPRSIKEGGLRFQDAADQYIAKQLFQMWYGYARIFAMIGALGALGAGIDFGEDPEETDFLRVRAGSTMYDFTGGMGAMYRMAVKVLTAWFGTSEGASYLAKKRNNFLESQGKSAIDAAIKDLIRNRLHPTITGIDQIITGKDFFGKPYHELFGPGAVGARAEAIARSLSPIFITTLMDQMFFTPNSNFTEDNFISILQFFGVNTFEFQDSSSSLESTEFFNRIKAKPNTEYPDQLSLSKNENDTRLQYLRMKYKEAYGNLMGDLIKASPNMTKAEFQSKLRSKSGSLKREFLTEHKDQIDKLNKIKK